jgi:hypothetical protein
MHKKASKNGGFFIAFSKLFQKGFDSFGVEVIEGAVFLERDGLAGLFAELFADAGEHEACGSLFSAGDADDVFRIDDNTVGYS